MPETAGRGQTAVRLRIEGRVQGVSYRAGAHAEALRLGVRGWVRNRRDGSVEALVAGSSAQVQRFIDWAWTGPPAARVERVSASPAAPPEGAGFERLPTL